MSHKHEQKLETLDLYPCNLSSIIQFKTYILILYIKMLFYVEKYMKVMQCHEVW